jgi:hypothetical protein
MHGDTDSSEPDLQVSIRHRDKVTALKDEPNNAHASYDQEQGKVSAGDEIIIEARDADVISSDSIGKKSYKITDKDIDNHGFTLEFDSVKSMKFQSIHENTRFRCRTIDPNSFETTTLLIRFQFE